MLVAFTWRNLWRNRRRTSITVGSVAASTAILIATYGLVQGMLKRSIDHATNMVVGEAQIHVAGYRTEQSLYKSIIGADEIVAAAENQGIGAVKRAFGFGLIAHGTKSSGALFWGVEPAAEARVFNLAEHLEHGKFVSPASPQGVVLGKRLARSLSVNVGDELIVVVQAADGSLGNELFHVEGILKSAGEAIDRNAAILNLGDFENLFVAAGRIHQIAFNGRGNLSEQGLETSIKPSLTPDLEYRHWRALLPMLSDMMKVMNVAIWIFGSIFFFVAGLGVMNTMLMATFERIREFGVLKALGTTPLRIVLEVTLEACLLALIGTVIGLILGLASVAYLMRYGIDTTGFAGSTMIAGVAFDPVWRATFLPKIIYGPLIVMWVVCFLASLYPGILAARLDPVKSIHHT